MQDLPVYILVIKHLKNILHVFSYWVQRKQLVQKHKAKYVTYKEESKDEVECKKLSQLGDMRVMVEINLSEEIRVKKSKSTRLI